MPGPRVKVASVEVAAAVDLAEGAVAAEEVAAASVAEASVVVVAAAAAAEEEELPVEVEDVVGVVALEVK